MTGISRKRKNTLQSMACGVYLFIVEQMAEGR